MNRLYSKLAFANIKNNREVYMPYLIAGIFTVLMYYSMAALWDNKGINAINHANNLHTILGLGLYVIAIFSVIFLFYTNSFIIKRRKKEIGIYNILGMEKRHIARVLLIETVFSMLVVISAGIITGIVFNKLMIMILYKITNLHRTIEFVISLTAVRNTLILFVLIYLLTYIYDLFQVKISKPIELLHGSSVGEREPKTKVIMSVLGFVCLGVGYYISITTENPMAALNQFFIAVIFVVIGTYLIFTAGSIAILKMLRKNKKFYYKTKNFTAVSGLMYRMKQNAAGLSNICILSTMVLVVISTTVSLYFGEEDILKSRYPKEVKIEAVLTNAGEDTGALQDRAEDVINQSGRKITDMSSYYSYTWMGELNENKFTIVDETNFADYNYSDIENMSSIYFITKEGYEELTGHRLKQIPKDSVVIAGCEKIKDDKIIIQDREFPVDRYYKKISEEDEFVKSVMKNMFYVIVNDADVLKDIYTLGGIADFNYNINIDTDGSSTDRIKLNEQLIPLSDAQDGSIYKEISIDTRESKKEDFYMLYGGLFFIGIFVGIMFLMITVLIIFYKQISEGYEDRERFIIMENVGMSKREVKQSIRAQVRMVFFIPLLMAFVHAAAAFPIVRRLLIMFNMVNTKLFVLCLAGTMAVFAVIYFIVFKITSAKYYRILTVSK